MKLSVYQFVRILAELKFYLRKGVANLVTVAVQLGPAVELVDLELECHMI